MARLIMGLLLCLLPAAVLGAEVRILENTPSILTAEVTAEYFLGDGDSRLDGRNLALEAAKRAAAETAGSYVESEVVIAGDRIEKERITTFSAAFLKTEVLEEAMAVTSEGRGKLTLRVRASLDKQDLRRRVAELREQPQKEKQIEELRKQNAELQKELKSLTAQLQALRAQPASGPAPKPRAELAERRDVVLSRLEQNEAAIRRVFEKGTLAGLARQSDSAYEKAREDIQTNLIGYLQKNMVVKLGEPRFRKSGLDRYEIAVPVEWSIDPKPLYQVLNRYFWNYSRKSLNEQNPMVVPKWQNAEDERKEAFSMDLFQHLMKKPLGIEVRAGKYRQHLTISGSNGYWGSGNEDYRILWRGQPGEKLVSRESNPVLIENVSAAELEKITSIEARVVEVKPK
jgi:ribosomal protein L29